MADNTAPYRPNNKVETKQLHVLLDLSEREKLMKLTRARKLSASDVIRSLIRDARLKG